MKRNFSMFTAFVLICISLFSASILTGCGNKGHDLLDLLDDSSTFDQGELTPVTLNFYLPGTEKKDAREVLDRVEAQSKLNITLVFKWFDFPDYARHVKSALAANEKVDAFVSGKGDQGTPGIAELFRNGAIKDITKLLPKYAPSIMKQLSPEELNASKVDGKIAAVPPLVSLADCLNVFIRKDLADKYGVSSMNTFEEYTSFLKQIREHEKDIVPGEIWGSYACDVDFYAPAYGYVVLDHFQNLVYKWDDPEMKIIPWEQTPEFNETAHLIDNWYKEGYIKNYNGNQRALASFMSIADNFFEGTEDVDVRGDGDKTPYAHFVLNKGKKLQRKSPMDAYNFDAVAVNSKSQNAERVLMFLNWVQSSQSSYDLLIYGIKGRHYTLNGERTVIPQEMKMDENRYGNWYRLPFLNSNFNRLSADDPAPDSERNKEKEYLKFNAVYAPHEGFFPDFRKLEMECESRFDLYQKKIMEPLLNGTYDPNEEEQVIKDLKSAGTDQIVQEIQKQLDQWKMAKKF